jgi:hypothetical protein
MDQAAAEFFKYLASVQPGWALLFIVCAILSYQTPLIIKEMFAGVRGLMVASRGRARQPAKQSPKPAPLESPALPSTPTSRRA